jgi:HEAT repeat protein
VSGVHDPGTVADGPSRRRVVALAGLRGDVPTARAGLADADPAVRSAALAALARAGGLNLADVVAGLDDPSPAVRRRACEAAVAARVAGSAPPVLARLEDPDATVVEVAAWALGELNDVTAVPPGTVAALSRVASAHTDALAREAAVAALGAIGDPEGLAAILVGTRDKPAVRRRAVLALAPFDGSDVDEALRRAATDRDWQVRQAAQLLGADPDQP